LRAFNHIGVRLGHVQLAQRGEQRGGEQVASLAAGGEGAFAHHVF
jgi:hypothetical protein